MYPFWKGYENFLIGTISGVDQNLGFISLGGEYVRWCAGEAGSVGGGLLVGCFYGVGWMEGVVVDSDVAWNGSI